MKKLYKKLECELMLWEMDVITSSTNGDGDYGYGADKETSGEEWPW